MIEGCILILPTGPVKLAEMANLGDSVTDKYELVWARSTNCASDATRGKFKTQFQFDLHPAETKDIR